MKEIILESSVNEDDITSQISSAFDYKYAGKSQEVITIPEFPKEFQIGLIVGSSGSGKSTIANTYFGGAEEIVAWDNSKSIASHFSSAQEASDRFGAVGLNSIPAWLKPYCVLSNGEKFRADTARRLKSNCVIDEFTSVVNREVAISCSMSISKYIKKNGLQNVVFCSCHKDIIPYLMPDWVYDTDAHEFYNGRYLQRPSIVVKVNTCDKRVWGQFKRHHYLSGELNPASRCYVATINDELVGFAAILAFPRKNLPHGYREHRIVIMPDYQGMGIGNKLSEMLGQAYVNSGCQYFAKTSNPRMGEHRDHSPLWKQTAHNHKSRDEYSRMETNAYRMSKTYLELHSRRVCYCHEFIGDGTKREFQKVRTDGQMSISDLFEL